MGKPGVGQGSSGDKIMGKYQVIGVLYCDPPLYNYFLEKINH